MLHWRIREELSAEEKLRRSYYELLRDDLDQFVIEYALIDSYKNFKRKKEPYPFPEKRELKPRAQLPKIEYENQNTFLVIFVEDVIPETCKKYIRFFDINRATRSNLTKTKSLPLEDFDRTQKFIESARFLNFLRDLLPLDYALLIQRDPASASTNHYAVTHFHVRVDWPIDDAAEDLARHLRYISKDLYERGDDYAESLQKKLFEYYGFPFLVGGRRTAALVAAQFLKRLPCISTVYVASSEARYLTRLSERGVCKTALTKLSPSMMSALAKDNEITLKELNENYLIGTEGKSGVFILQVLYMFTESAREPEDGKLRVLNPANPWLTVENQYILPRDNKGERRKRPPLKINLIYTEQKKSEQ
ncbi:MAG: hypothetical protein B5M56_07275 [Desulfococcus sp. 4484_241]|nr:MAG: hypothetical protein B5M56_07275 [Desulfococcus sp. 4484_241]